MQEFFECYEISFVKDILIPSISLDKIITLFTFIIAIITIIKNNRIAKISFVQQLTNSHREIWIKISDDKKLLAILNPKAKTKSISPKQNRYVIMIILNTKLSYDAHKKKVFKLNKEDQIDTGDFFNLPIPSTIWEDVKNYYESDFVSYIEKARKAALIEKQKNIAKVSVEMGG